VLSPPDCSPAGRIVASACTDGMTRTSGAVSGQLAGNNAACGLAADAERQTA
jgi:hypothetical protein